MMKIVVIGPGALGCLLAAALAAKFKPGAGQDQNPPTIWLLDHDRERASLLAEKGLLLEEDGARYFCRPKVTATPAAIGHADLILLCVKSRDVQAGLQSAGALASAGSLLITLQNGIDHLAGLRRTSLPGAMAVGVTAQGATLIGPGHVRHAGRGLTRVGFIKATKGREAATLAAAAALLSAAAIETVPVDNIIDHVWAKMFVNVGINALTAIYDCANGRLLEIPAAREQLISAVREAEKIARAKGLVIKDDPVAATLAVCRATAANLSSMLQDVKKKRPTEIAAINGAVVAEGRRLAIAAPTNEALIRAVKNIEQGYEESHENSSPADRF